VHCNEQTVQSSALSTSEAAVSLVLSSTVILANINGNGNGFVVSEIGLACVALVGISVGL